MRWLAGRLAILQMALAGICVAQQFPFQLRVSSSTSAATVANGSSIGFSAEVGQSQAARLTATYVGIGKVTVPQSPQLFGSPDFTATLGGSPPLTLNSGDSLIVDFTYRPSNASGANAQFSLPFTETISSTNPPTVANSLIALTLQGTAPSFTLSYILQSDLNTIPLQPGGTVSFADTLINTTASASLNIANLGTAAGQITNVTLRGDPAFKLVGLPLFPATINPAQQLQLLIHYLPTVVGSNSAQVQITYGAGSQPVTVNLQGNGVSPMFTYDLLQGDQTTPVTPPGPISLPDADVGSQSTVVIRVKNSGNASGTINTAPGIAGAGFQLSGLPLFPQTLKPNESFAFTITFTANQPGDQTGQLLIGGDLFTLNARGLGPKLAFSYVSGGTTTALGPNASVVFSPVAVGQSEQLDFIATNSGTTAAKISNIGIGEAKSPFSLTSVPPFPISLDPGASTQFMISFTPSTTGFSTGTLHIDTTTVPLVGSGTPPPPLPSYTFQGPSGNVSPRSQPAVHLQLASPYPLALAGVLTLSTSSDLVDDPAVQFATGGRTVPFVIPANSTDANFANQGPQIRLQTGTVANTITLTPTFVTQDGGVDVTPASPTTLQFSVGAAAPALIAVQPVNETPSSFTLNITGYSTTRTLTSASIQFTAAGTSKVGTAQVTIDLRQASAVWFQSSASQTFGGQFTVSLPFTLQGTPPSGTTLLQAIASVSATLSNEVGASNALQATLP